MTPVDRVRELVERWREWARENRARGFFSVGHAQDQCADELDAEGQTLFDELIAAAKANKAARDLSSALASEGQAVAMEWTEYEEALHRMQPAEQCLQPWLLGDGHGEAKYTVVYDEHGNYWMAKWWHGNRGYSADGWWHHRTKEEAKESCRAHLQRMRSALNGHPLVRKKLCERANCFKLVALDEIYCTEHALEMADTSRNDALNAHPENDDELDTEGQAIFNELIAAARANKAARSPSPATTGEGEEAAKVAIAPSVGYEREDAVSLCEFYADREERTNEGPSQASELFRFAAAALRRGEVTVDERVFLRSAMALVEVMDERKDAERRGDKAAVRAMSERYNAAKGNLMMVWHDRRAALKAACGKGE